MKTPAVYYHNNFSPGVNLALEEFLTTQTCDEIFMLWRNSSSIIVGRNQDISAEIDLDYVQKFSIPVFRRMSGGGTVYHDRGTINFTYITSKACSFLNLFYEFYQVVLQKFSLEHFELCGNDFLLSGRKFCGMAQAIFGQRYLFHGCILYKSDLAVLNRVLTPSKVKLNKHSISSVEARVCNLSEHLSCIPTIDAFMTLILKCAVLFFQSKYLLALPDNFLPPARVLAAEKYREWEASCITTSL